MRRIVGEDGGPVGCPFGGVCVSTCAWLLRDRQWRSCAVAKMAEYKDFVARRTREEDDEAARIEPDAR